jgi:hypothetical protein
VKSLTGEFLSQCAHLYGDYELFTVRNDPELAEMVSIGRAQQWEAELDWRGWCDEHT